MAQVVMLCGVPGAGKSWVAAQLSDKFHYISHDQNDDLPSAVAKYIGWVKKPILIDCPFAERILREKLEARGWSVRPVFIVEQPDVIAYRYAMREGKPASKSTITRSLTIKNRAMEWEAFYGTSDEVLAHLKSS